jgi:hypothetical protein
MSVNGAFKRDENFVPITTLGLQETKSITFAAGTTGAIDTTTLFTVTGTVACNVFAICTADLTGSGTIEVGVAGATAVICDQRLATAIDNNEVWHDSVLAVAGQVAGHQHIIKQSVIQTIATDTVTGGSLTYYCLWTPLSDDGNVVAV